MQNPNGYPIVSVDEKGRRTTAASDRSARRLLSEGSIAEAIKSGRARARTYSGSNWTANPGAVAAGVNNAVNAGFVVNPGFRFLLTGLTISTDGECIVRSRVTPDSGSTWVSGVSNAANGNQLSGYLEIATVFGAGGGSAVVPLPAGLMMAENTSLTNSYATGGTTARRVAYVATGYEIPLDWNPHAKIRVAVGLDSNTAGANLGNDANGRKFFGSSLWYNKLVSLARASGADAGVFANWGEDGKTYEDFAHSLVTGQWGGDFDRLVLLGGTNDAASAKYTSTEQLQAWIRRVVDWRDQFFPNDDKRILFCAPILTDSADLTGGGRIAAVRAALSAIVATLQGEGRTGIDYLDCSNAFALNATAANDVNFKNSERVAGSRVHMSGIGSTLLGQYIFDQKKSFLFDI